MEEMNMMTKEISTHALTEGDSRHPGKDGRVEKFQLTPSRRATRNQKKNT